jgi:hypothetical protein
MYTAAGRQIAGFQMSDHNWHRGLWFTIKFINKTNFWEERPPFGVQQTLGQPHCRHLSEDAVSISQNLRWTAEATGAVIDESREMTFSLLPDGVRQIDFSNSLLALQDLLLDRTPFTTWGGYGGLTFRGSREVHNGSYLLPDGQTAASILGQAHPWALLRASLDGAPDARFCIGMIGHPTNPRSPQPFYARAGQSYDFMNAAFLFHEPMPLAKGQSLSFRYRVLYRDGWWEPAEFAPLADGFSKSQR